jgi:hypothetical protein
MIVAIGTYDKHNWPKGRVFSPADIFGDEKVQCTFIGNMISHAMGASAEDCISMKLIVDLNFSCN